MELQELQQPTPLELVLRRVDLSTRLGCCVVSRAWHAAATAASSSLQLGQTHQQQCSALEPWLQRHGARLDALSVTASCGSVVLGAHQRTQSGGNSNTSSPAHSSSSCWRMPQLRLPVAQLQPLSALSLKLMHCTLVPGDISTGSGLAALTGLQRLCVVDSDVSLQGLASLRGLQHLELCHSWGAPQPPGRGGRPALFSSRGSGAGSHYGSMNSSGGGSSSCGSIAGAATATAGSSSNPALVAEALPYLEGLTHLALAGSYGCADVLSALGRSHSNLQELVLGWPAPPKPLVAGYENYAANLELHQGSAPGLARLSSLRKLVIASAAECVDPGVLLGLQLTHLQLDDVRLCPRLSMLGAFMQLRHLSINHKAGSVTALAPEDCPGLTASPQLTHLGLTGCWLPPNGCSLLFPAARQLPHLMKLEATRGLFVEPAAMARIALACPRLESISTQQPTAAAAAEPATAYLDLSGIDHLPNMRLLVLHGVTVVGSASLRALGQLTRLQELLLDSVRGISLTDVMQLASCMQLRELRLPQLHITEVLAANVNLTDPQSTDSCTPPIVWRLLPQALVKQALWVYPFRLQHRAEELMQVAELLDACAVQFGQQLDTSAHASQLQAQMLEAGRALLMLQHSSQQQPVPAGPARQQWQQQCQWLREAVLKAADEQQGDILCSTRSPAGAQQQQLGLTTTALGVGEACTPLQAGTKQPNPPSAVVMSAPAPAPFANNGLGSGLHLPGISMAGVAAPMQQFQPPLMVSTGQVSMPTQLSRGIQLQASTPDLTAPQQYQHQHPSLLLQPSMAPALMGHHHHHQQQQQHLGGSLHMPPQQQYQQHQQQAPQPVLLGHMQAAASAGGSPLQFQPQYQQYHQQQIGPPGSTLMNVGGVTHMLQPDQHPHPQHLHPQQPQLRQQQHALGGLDTGFGGLTLG